MVFNSFLFIVFFAIVTLVTFLPISWRLRKGFLVLASYFFYSLWNPFFVLLLLFSTALDFLLAHRMETADSSGKRKIFLGLSILANIGLLAVFKYGDFFLENIEFGIQLLGAGDIRLGRMEVDLPVGISFYTFQSMSYSIDVYRRTRKPHSSALDFALYVSFFPQLVAGPIIRSEVFLSQTQNPPTFDMRRIGLGLWLILIGLFLKTVFADGLLAPIVEKVYSVPGKATAQDAIAGTVAFSSQIYFDFAGYSTCAIGVARILGFHFPENFRFPFAALSFSEFWRRWHISLSTWLRDYVYISMGGNRRGLWLTYLFLFITMLLGGLWHGASWNFVIWGALHGVFLSIERLFNLRYSTGHRKLKKREYFLSALPRQFIVFLGVNIAWVFFRSESFTGALEIFMALGKFGGLEEGILTNLEKDSVIFVTLGVVFFNWRYRNRDWSGILARLTFWKQVFFAALLLMGIITLAPGSKAFIYFQF